MSPEVLAVESRLSVAEIVRRARKQAIQEVAEEREERLRGAPELARLWIALAPGWTIRLADACDFPGASEAGGASQLFTLMQNAGLIDAYVPEDRATDPNAAADFYIMNEETRAAVLQAQLQSSVPAPAAQQRIVAKSSSVIGGLLRGHDANYRPDDSPARRLLDVAAEAGSRIEAKHKEGLETPARLRRWAGVAARIAEPDAAVGFFRQQVADAAATADPEAGVGAVRDWIEAARPLAALMEYALDPQLSIAIALAGRRMELIRRRRYDLRHLTSFYRRADQVAAVKELLTGRDDLWALHLIGAGGVGKTMIIRYITCALARQRGPDTPADSFYSEPEFAGLPEIAIARIDFDYLNPDYPRLRPGLLLTSLAQELRAHDDKTGSANSYFDQAEQSFDKLHKRLIAEAYSATSRPTADPEFQTAIRIYIDALRQLRRPILLILDTCEELDKADSESLPSVNVAETFRILCALHDGPAALLDDNAPATGGFTGLRVLLSGRRPLASRGHGWSMQDPAAFARFRPAPFLRLDEIRGFTRPEAEDYVAQEQVPEGLRDAVIRASMPDAGSALQVNWESQARRLDDVMRCNPYRLHTFIDWARSDPPPARETLLAPSMEKYVQMRIIQRLRDPALEQVLPVVALLGHFDHRLLAAAAGIGEAAAAGIFDKLSVQEWAGRHPGSQGTDGAELIIDVQKNQLDSLYRYYQGRGEIPATARAASAGYLEKLTLDPQRGLIGVDWSHFDAALRVLEGDLERGAAWWQQVEARLWRERDAAWIENLAGLLLGRDGSAGARDPQAGVDVPNENRLRPFVLATLAAAQLHSPDSGKQSRVAEAWREVVRKAASQADSPDSGRLLRRGLAGQIAATRFSRIEPDPGLAARFWQAWAEGAQDDGLQEAASALAACEMLVEAAERRAPEGRAALAPLLSIPGPGPLEPELGPRLLADQIAAMREGRPPDEVGGYESLAAYAASLAARALLACEQAADALDYFRRSLAGLRSFPANPRAWIDWLPPADLATRVRLEFARGAYPALLPPGQVWELLGPEAEQGSSFDGELLRSTRRRLELAQGLDAAQIQAVLGPVPAASGLVVLLDRVEAEGPPGSWNAHRAVPLLFATASDLLLANGLAEPALPQLQKIIQDTRKFDHETIRQADRAMARLVRRMRLNDEGETAGSTLAASPEPADLNLYLSLRGLEGPRAGPLHPSGAPAEGNPSWAAHVFWRTRYALDPDRRAEALAFAEQYLPADAGNAGASKAGPAVTESAPADSPVIGPAPGDASMPVDAQGSGTFGGGVPPEQEAAAKSTTDADAAPRWAPGLVGFQQASLALDRMEASLLAGASAEALPDLRTWIAAHPDRPAEGLRLLLRLQALWDGSAHLMPPDLIERLGARAAAEIALDEGELLALRLPERATDSLERARAWYEAANDNVGALFATTLELMTLGHTLAAPAAVIRFGPGRERYDSLLDRTRTYYKAIADAAAGPSAGKGPAAMSPATSGAPAAESRLQDTDPGVPEVKLPPWADLKRLAAAPSTEGLDGLAPRTWRPWLVRLVFCMAQREALAAGGKVDVAPAWDWLAATYGAGQKDGARLPAEWHLWPRSPASETIIARRRVVTSGVPDEAARSGRDFTWVLGLAILAGLLVGGFLLFRWATGQLLGGRSLTAAGLGAQIGYYAALLVGLGLLAWLAPRLMKAVVSLWAAQGYLEIAIGPGVAESIQKIGPQPGNESGPTMTRLTHWRPRLSPAAWPPLVRQPIPLADTVSQTWIPDTPYRALADALPASVAGVIEDLARRLGARRMTVTLRVAARCHAPAWEAMLALHSKQGRSASAARFLRQFAGSPLQPFLFQRSAEGALAPRPIAGGGAVQVVTVAATQGAREMAKKGWSAVAGRSALWQVIPALGEPDDTVQVVHVVGMVEETFTVLAVRLAREQYYQSNINAPQSAQTAAPGQVNARDLQERYPGMRICIIQGEPGELSPERLGSDRRSAGLARNLAGEIAGRGVTVVLLPPLAPSLAAEALGRVAAALPDAVRRGSHVWLTALDDVRALIWAQPPTAGVGGSPSSAPAAGQDASWDPGNEAALDVCLYAAEAGDGTNLPAAT